MSSIDSDRAVSVTEFFLANGSELGSRMREFAWESTLLGPAQLWPQSLRTSVSICLNSRFAILVWWGPDLVMLYNDAYSVILGSKHPAALGMPGRDCWPEIWHIIEPMLNGVLERGEATWSDDLVLLLERRGYPEECYFTFSYSPIHDESGGIGGVFTPVHETTERVIGERRLRTLERLASRAVKALDAVEACRLAAEAIASNAWDLPFAAIYLFEPGSKLARLAAVTGVEPNSAITPTVVDLESHSESSLWPARNNRTTIIRDLSRLPAPLPSGAWALPATALILIPVSTAGFIVTGESPRKRLDQSYQSFLELVAQQVANAVAEAATHEQERRRAEALAELDRAKTLFFSNVSHEFRTPLTLLLGPLQDILDEPGSLTPDARALLETAHRNALRLQKLVNTLLEFSRIEAGRIQANYEITNLARLTEDLASNFRSSIERSGMELAVHCQPVPEVYVDRQMWEEIVLNLLSNAFKFTLRGRIDVSLEQSGTAIQLIVADTGVGIPNSELPHIFERFHRVKDAGGRTYEGSGIGLALVAEFVKLHGGNIDVSSGPGVGSVFTVSIPMGVTHLPPDRVSSARSSFNESSAGAIAASSTNGWLQEAYQLAPSGDHVIAYSDSPQDALGKRIVVADDNSDMRAYLSRILQDHWRVRTVTNGEEAFETVIREGADLVLTDIMMPRMDGFGLLKALRGDARSRAIPVILLSARAGEEARLEGLETGADDYLVKPFIARELVARVRAQLLISQIRNESQRALEALVADLKAERTRTEEANQFLQNTNEALRRANSDLEQFAYSASHDLREPLRTIIVYNQLLERHLGGKLDGDADTFMRNVVSASRRLESLVHDLLAYLQATHEPTEGEPECESRTALDRVLADLAAAIAESHAVVSIVDLPRVAVHQAHLEQVFQNLIGNAIKYRRSVPPQIEVTARHRAGFVEFDVADNGIGIAPKYLKQIFGLFKRLHTADQFPGTGIGLAICQKIVERYGGRIHARSKLEEGSVFTFSLPAAQSAMAAEEENAAS